MNAGWAWLRPEERDFDAVLQRLLKEASEAIPGLSPDLRQADPVAVMLLRAFAREYVELYRLMDDSVGLAYRSLVSRLLTFPRAPEPATTVLRLDTKDPGARIPTEFHAVAAQPVTVPGRRSAQALFSPIAEGRTSSFEVAALVLVAPSGGATRLPDPPYPGLPDRWQAKPRATAALFVALDSADPAADDRAEIFLYGDAQGVRSCLWSPWHVPDRLGGLAVGLRSERPEPAFVPGGEFHDRVPYDPPLFTFRSDLRRPSSPYEPQIVAVGGPSLLSQACALPRELGESTTGLPPVRGVRHWVRITLASDADLGAVTGIRARTNSVLAANRELRSSGAIVVDDTPIHAWVLPDDVSLENLLRVERVLDLKSGYEFSPATTREGLDAVRSYRLAESAEGDRRRLRVEVLNREESRRRSEIQIDYSLTLGPAANGLGPGTVSVAFTPAQVFPGLTAVTNLVPTLGGRAAPAAELQEEELRLALRARGRAVVANDFVQMVRAFDHEQRIREVGLARGVARGPHGLRSSVVVTGRTPAGSFVNELERESFQRRLAAYLQDRCSIGETVEVRLAEEVA
jgi:hypothetical protein